MFVILFILGVSGFNKYEIKHTDSEDITAAQICLLILPLAL